MRRLTPHPTEDTAALVTPLARLIPVGQQLRQVSDLPDDVITDASTLSAQLGRPLMDVLYQRFGYSSRDLLRTESAMSGAAIIDPKKRVCDIRLVHQWGVDRALRSGLLPWRKLGGDVVVLTNNTEVFAQNIKSLEDEFQSVRMALATEEQIVNACIAHSAGRLVHRAETRVERPESCRSWSAQNISGVMALSGVVLLAAVLLAPLATLAALTGFTVITLALATVLKAAAAIAQTRAPGPARDVGATTGQLPIITLLIPLYRERAIAEHLLRRLEALDYPRELLDVCLILESDDTTTKDALGRIALMKWIRTVTVPPGTIKTKPRALNYALDFARGSIIGVYDAEDAPAPDQLRKVAAGFATAAPKVACLQGILDYYNSGTNWLTRCFTIEYAGWFRVILPGLARLGLVVPLGGTTLFFRRDILEKLGGWDAHNVTEDADLGIRLARHGYRTVFLNTVTEEEANGRFWPWVKQRSRWLKGYAVTYGVHMRHPVTLWQELGAWRFLGLNILFAGTLVQFLLAPLLWTFWLVLFGLPHPIAQVLPVWAFWSMAGLFVFTELTNLAIAWIGLRRAGKGRLWPWAISLQLYFPLGTAAVYKGLFELGCKPFYWDKTAHGMLMPGPILPPEPSLHPASTG